MPGSEEITPDFGRPQTRAIDVVVIDDEESLCEACRQTLDGEGFSTAVARDGARGLDLVKKLRPRVVLLDLKMPGMSGTEVLLEIPNIDPSISTIIMTGYGTIDVAVDSMKSGAFDFLTKPFEPDRVVEAVRRGLEQHQFLEKAALKDSALGQAPVTEKISKEKGSLNRQNVLLKGLEALGEYYELEPTERNFFHELSYMEAEAKYHAESLGQITKKEKAVREIVQDIRNVDEIIAEHEYQKSALLQILLDIQKQINWLPRHLLKWVSGRLNVPMAEILTIVNFYEAFSLEPRGKHIVQGCTGAACHVRGATDLITRVSSILGIAPGETDSKHLFTMKTVHCMGCCALAPVIKIDDKYYSNPDTPKLKKILTLLEEQEL